MKFTRLIIIIILCFSCSSTKKSIENETNKVTENSKTKSSITKAANQSPEKQTIKTHELWNNLLRKHVLDNGKVNYKGLKNDRKDLYKYLQVLNANLPNASHSKDYKLAYWINAYNAMTVDLILRHYPVKRIKDIEKPWQQRYWKLGNKWYNLNDIEHEVLRKMEEPRIHFAIVCASVSCPKLLNEAYTASNLSEQLTKVTKAFLNDSTKNNLSENNIELSKIFQWFAKDFKQIWFYRNHEELGSRSRIIHILPDNFSFYTLHSSSKKPIWDSISKPLKAFDKLVKNRNRTTEQSKLIWNYLNNLSPEENNYKYIAFNLYNNDAFAKSSS